MNDMSWTLVIIAAIASVTFLLYVGKCEAPENADIKCVKAGGTWVRVPGCGSDYCQSKEKR